MRSLLASTAAVLLLASCGTDPVSLSNGDLTMPAGCGDDSQCSAPTPRCYLNTRTCVPCLPDNDNCPKGQHCVASNGTFLCSAACVTNADCPRSDAGSPTTCCNGSCIDTSSDIQSCGRCGNNCLALPNASAGCSGGMCGIGSCNLGFLDCDRGAANGCEVNATTDERNCGACGKVCTAGPNQSLACTNGTCTTSCNAGFDDCDKTAVNGCEVSVNTDARNCGACGTACSLANASAVCKAGACTVDACNAGFGDCNAMAKDGCESDLKQDVVHCGSCMSTCMAANGVPICRNGGCGIASCNMGFADCDSLVINGCEVAAASDAKNCGACNHVCSGGNSVQACQGGACMITACSMGFSDCDRKPETGCEIATGSDPKNCGGCGMICPTPTNATAACANAVCGIGQCNFGFLDCNKDPKDGCEVDIQTVQNCGMCGNVCMAPANATAGCKVGVCGIGMCNNLFGDCDGNAQNGCEKNLSNDPANCGKCGAACNFANGVGACLGGVCGLFSCNQGFGNCDNNPANGCETGLTLDNNNCGACGKVCGMGFSCLAGQCVANPCPNPQWIPSQQNWTQNNLVYASEILNNSYNPTNLLDNNITTRWVTSSTTKQWVIFDLGRQSALSGIKILNQADYTANAGGKDTIVQVGPAVGGPWSDVTSFTVANQQNSFQEFYFKQTQSQFWRVYVLNNWGFQNYIQFMEVGFYGCN